MCENEEGEWAKIEKIQVQTYSGWYVETVKIELCALIPKIMITDHCSIKVIHIKARNR
tara:strand:- start:146 stop:319 length:174 start_codon:yes stop_codon:yes gene_type:complete